MHVWVYMCVFTYLCLCVCMYVCVCVRRNLLHSLKTLSSKSIFTLCILIWPHSMFSFPHTHTNKLSHYSHWNSIFNFNFNFKFNLNDARSMEPIMDNGVQTLSGGELQRCAIVLCLGTAADIYLVPSLHFPSPFPFSLLHLFSPFFWCIRHSYFFHFFVFNTAIFPLFYIFYSCLPRVFHFTQFLYFLYYFTHLLF